MAHEIKVGRHGEGCECPHCSIYWPYAQWKEADQTKCETLHKKKPSFQPQYFSGLNWRKALKKGLVGREVEFSVNGDGWNQGKLNKIIKRDLQPYRYQKFTGSCYTYIRTTPETFKHPTITIGDKELPRPEVEAPKKGTEYWVHLITGGLEVDHWSGCQFEFDILAQGRVHLKESRAQEWASWWSESVISAIKRHGGQTNGD